MDKMEFLGLMFMLSVAPIASVFSAIMIAQTGGYWVWIVALVGATASFMGGWIVLAIEFMKSEEV